MKRLCLCLCLVLTGCADDRVEARWRPPPGVLPGLELVGIDRWGGDGPNRRLAQQYLELRCHKDPDRLVRKSYWPGPEWSGNVSWMPGAITYHHRTHNPSIQNLTFGPEDVARLGRCP